MFAYFIRFFWYFFRLLLLGKVFFLIINASEFWPEVKVFPYLLYRALALDISMMAYLLLLPFTFMVFAYYTGINFRKPLKIYLWVVSLLLVLVQAADPFYFKYWGLKLNFLALQYSSAPDGWLSIPLREYLAAAIYFLIGYLFIRSNQRRITLLPAKSGLLKSLIAVFILLIAIRGGLGKTTVGVSSAYFSERDYRNACAVNPLWNLMAYELNRKAYKPLETIQVDDAEQLFGDIKAQSQLPDNIFNINDSTNVIMIILESFSAKASFLLSKKYTGVSPVLDSLMNSSLYYSAAYAHSFRSDKGLAAILYGMPSLADINPADFPDLIAAKPDLFSAFADKSYQTLMYYGGDAGFANIGVLFREADVYRGEDYFSKGVRNSWGYHDEHVFNTFANDLEDQNQPFFSVVFSISGHEPFKVPGYRKFENEYLNAQAYTDSCVGVFIDRIRKMGLWDNSLIVITSDHGTVHPDQLMAPEPSNYHIPLIFTGGAVQKGHRVDDIVSQLDIASGLNELFNLNRNFKYSHSLIHPLNIAFYNYYNGLVMLSDSCEQWFDIPLNTYLKGPCDKPYEKAFFYLSHSDFINYEQ